MEEIDNNLQQIFHKKFKQDNLKNMLEPSGAANDKWNLFEKVKKCHLYLLRIIKLMRLLHTKI